MTADGAIFVRRALALLEDARTARGATPQRLAAAEEISLPTARRVLARLRYEYHAPLEYSSRHRAWFLGDNGWRFRAADLVPPDEMDAAAIALRLGAGGALDPGLAVAADALRRRIRESLGVSVDDYRRLEDAWSGDRTDAVALRDPLVLRLAKAIALRRIVTFDYRSPWRDGSRPRSREASPEHLRQSDGAIYLLGAEAGQQRVFHLGGMERVEVTHRPAPPIDAERVRRWRAGFGVWFDEQVVPVTVVIRSHAARYYARQLWHPDQRDIHRPDGSLERCFPASPSPEVVRRLLSLGEDLVEIDPPALARAARRALARALAALEDTDRESGA